MPIDVGLYHGDDWPHIYVAGSFLSDQGSTGSLTPTLNVKYLTPLRIPRLVVVTALACNIVSGFASTQTLRMGIYNADPNVLTPGSLLVDAGTMVPTANGAQQITLGSNETLNPGLYYTCFVSQGTTHPSMSCAGSLLYRLPRSSYASASSITGITGATSSGALPTPFGTATFVTTNVPVVAVKIQ